MPAADLLGKIHRNTDLLEKYRRVTDAGVPSSASANVGKKADYEAYRTGTEARQFLEIRFKAPSPIQAPGYRMLTYLKCERKNRAISLQFGPHMKIVITGANLAGLFQALQRWKVEHVQEFDPEHFESPNDTASPYISKIEIRVTEKKKESKTTAAESKKSEAEMSTPPEA
jgi:hypothetical protein